MNTAAHGFLRATDGMITTFDAPGAGKGAGQGTEAMTNNREGAVSGFYIDANNVYHGFLRNPVKRIVTTHCRPMSGAQGCSAPVHS